MEIQQLEFHLNKGTSFGYNTKNDAEIIGWIILSKRQSIPRFFERFTKKDNPVLFQEQVNIRDKPYNVWIAEMKKEAYEADRFPGNDDYLLNENYTFGSLNEVEGFLNELHLKLADIKWSSEVEFL